MLALEPQRPVEILEKYRLNFSIDENQSNQDMLNYKDKISTFQVFLNRAYTALEVSADERATLIPMIPYLIWIETNRVVPQVLHQL